MGISFSQFIAAIGLQMYLRDGKVTYRGLTIEKGRSTGPDDPDGICIGLVNGNSMHRFALVETISLDNVTAEEPKGQQLRMSSVPSNAQKTRELGKDLVANVAREMVRPELPRAVEAWVDDVVVRLEAIEARLTEAEDRMKQF